MSNERRIPHCLAAGLLVLGLSEIASADTPASEAGSSATSSGSASSAAPAAIKPKVVPAILIRKDKLSANDDPHLPDLVKARYRCGLVTGSYKVCIGTSGEIASVDTVAGIPDADNQIAATILKWRYKPQAIPICFIQFLEYHIDGGEICDRPEMIIQVLRQRVEMLERRLSQVEQRLAALPPRP